jgi:hypothetical protein
METSRGLIILYPTFWLSKRAPGVNSLSHRARLVASACILAVNAEMPVKLKAKIRPYTDRQRDSGNGSSGDFVVSVGLGERRCFYR